MGSVCSSGVAEKNKNVNVGRKNFGSVWKLKKKKSFVSKNKIGDSNTPNSRTININGIQKQKKRDSGFSSALKGSQKGSFLGRAGERAVEVLDTLGSSMPKLSSGNVFVSGMAPRGNKISILAFEVANTINKGAILFQSLSEENIQFLKKEVLESEGVQQLVSTDTKELIALLDTDKREEFNAFSREVARFGNMCKDQQWHNLDRYFSRLDLDVLGNKQPRIEAEKTMQDLTTLAQNTAELYHELNAFQRFEQDYQQKVKEMESLNLPLKGESLTIFQSELKNQKKVVKGLQKKSLWSRNLEEIVEKLVDVVFYMHQAISKFLGNHGTNVVKYSNGSERLGEAGLALHYANIINQIHMIASRPSALPANIRDTLYHGLPRNIKNALSSRLQNLEVTKELSMTQVKAEMDKILQWLTPFATNTTKAHQGFGWVGEWANGGNEFGHTAAKESNLIRLQTLHYADKQKIDSHIIELLAWLHQLVSFVRFKHNSSTSIAKNNKPKAMKSKGIEMKSKMMNFVTIENGRNKKKHIIGTPSSQISQEDKNLLEEVLGRRRAPGVSKSDHLALNKKNKKKRNELNLLHSSKSVGSSPFNRDLPDSHVLDLMDGLTF